MTYAKNAWDVAVQAAGGATSTERVTAGWGVEKPLTAESVRHAAVAQAQKRTGKDHAVVGEPELVVRQGEPV